MVRPSLAVAVEIDLSDHLHLEIGPGQRQQAILTSSRTLPRISRVAGQSPDTSCRGRNRGLTANFELHLCSPLLLGGKDSDQFWNMQSASGALRSVIGKKVTDQVGIVFP